MSTQKLAQALREMDTFRPVWLQYGASMHRDVTPNPDGWVRVSDVLAALASAEIKESVMRNCGCPHYLCTVIVIFRLGYSQRSIFYHGLSVRLDKSVRHVAAPDIHKISLHKMRKHIRSSAGDLICRQ